jgi:hypothetical protein
MSSSSDCSGEGETIAHQKEKFHKQQTKIEMVNILTALSKNWSSRKVEQEFKASN